jgi:hypothetical protein
MPVVQRGQGQPCNLIASSGEADDGQESLHDCGQVPAEWARKRRGCP